MKKLKDLLVSDVILRSKKHPKFLPTESIDNYGNKYSYPQTLIEEQTITEIVLKGNIVSLEFSGHNNSSKLDINTWKERSCFEDDTHFYFINKSEFNDFIKRKVVNEIITIDKQIKSIKKAKEKEIEDIRKMYYEYLNDVSVTNKQAETYLNNK